LVHTQIHTISIHDLLKAIRDPARYRQKSISLTDEEELPLSTSGMYHYDADGFVRGATVHWIDLVRPDYK
jgi:hypothetical protein